MDLEPTYYCRKDNVCVLKNEEENILAVVFTNEGKNCADIPTVVCKEVYDVVTVNVEELDNLLGVVNKPSIYELCCLLALGCNELGESINKLLIDMGCVFDNIFVSKLCKLYGIFSNKLCRNDHLIESDAAKLERKLADDLEMLLCDDQQKIESLKSFGSDSLVVYESLDLGESSLGKGKLLDKESLSLCKAVDKLSALKLSTCGCKLIHSEIESCIKLSDGAVVSKLGVSRSIHFLVVVLDVINDGVDYGAYVFLGDVTLFLKNLIHDDHDIDLILKGKVLAVEYNVVSVCENLYNLLLVKKLA